jgi:hypothetical protein
VQNSAKNPTKMLQSLETAQNSNFLEKTEKIKQIIHIVLSIIGKLQSI